MSPDTAQIGCRFVHDASSMLLWGTFACLSALVPPDLALATGRRLQTFRLVAIALAVLTTVVALPVTAGVIGEGWSSAVDPATIGDVVFDTSVGWAWQAQALAGLMLTVTVLIRARAGQIATALASGLSLGSVALTGHTALHTGWPGLAHSLNDAVHLLSAGAWLGALVPLVPILHVVNQPGPYVAAMTALRRFSTAGHIAVTLVIATGAINTALVLGRWSGFRASGYEVLLVVKIALVAVMVLIAVINRYVLVPRIKVTRAAAIRLLIRGTLAELIAGAGVVFLVSVFGTMDPA